MAGQRLEFVLTHLSQLRIGVASHFLSGRNVVAYELEFREQIDYGFDAGIFHRQFPKLILIADDLGIGKQPCYFFEAISHRFQLIAN